MNLCRNGTILNRKYENGACTEDEKVDASAAYYPIDWAEYQPDDAAMEEKKSDANNDADAASPDSANQEETKEEPLDVNVAAIMKSLLTAYGIDLQFFEV